MLGPDGKLLSKNYEDLACFLIDPLDCTKEGIREAEEYGDTTAYLSFLANLHQQTRNLHDTAQRMTLSRDKEKKKDYQTKVGDFFGTESFLEKANAYLEEQREEFRESPELVLGRINKEKEYQKKLPQLFPEAQITENQEFARKGSFCKSRLDAAISKIPDYLRIALENEPVNVIIHERNPHPDGSYAHGYAKGCEIIGFCEDSLAQLSADSLSCTVKEEFWHYFDNKFGYSNRTDFRAAADALMKDPDKMAEINKIARGLLGDEKQSIMEYKEELRYNELLVDYLHARDYLNQLSQRSGCTFVGKLFSKSPSANEDVNRQLEAIFGKEIHRICTEFDQKLHALGTSYQTKQGAIR